MSAHRQQLWGLARALRCAAFMLDHWLVVLFVVCVLSPISPHVRLPNNMFASCSYVGAHGIIYRPSDDCPAVMMIDTREHGGLWW